ncbi:MAG: ISKra4 family transposase, partial [Anaerolineales bacterium]
PEEEGSILVVTVDGKGVPMRRKASERPGDGRKRRRKGEKANKKREACVGGVYSIEPFVRTPQHIVNDTLRKRCREDRPEPRHKRLRAELTRPIDGQEVRGKELTFRWLVEEVTRRRQPGQPLIFLSDGDDALHRMQRDHLPGAVCILDIYHAVERLWDAATCFHPEGSQEANDFVTQRLERILEGKVGHVVGGLRQMATKHRLRGSRLAQLNGAVGYLSNQRAYMSYDEYLAKGYPIGSGVAEGACRHLVKDRMEGTGMRWIVPGAQAMLHLRAVWLNDDWDAFQNRRAQEEQRLLHPYRSLVQQQWERKAA